MTVLANLLSIVGHPVTWVHKAQPKQLYRKFVETVASFTYTLTASWYA